MINKDSLAGVFIDFEIEILSWFIFIRLFIVYLKFKKNEKFHLSLCGKKVRLKFLLMIINNFEHEIPKFNNSLSITQK